MKKIFANCATCPFEVSERACRKDGGKAPAFCPTLKKANLIQRAVEKYKKDPAIHEFARQASIQEGEGYGDKELGYDRIKPIKPRIVEIIEFANKMGFKKLGLAFCSGLRKEAKVVEKILSSTNNFLVVSAICKAGRIPKEEIGVRDDQKIAAGTFEPMCNPIMQAFVLNDAKTELNILLGLCVGHDALFLKYADAPCTVFAVKDRVFGHNPLAAVYNIDSYYRCLKTVL